MGLEMSLIEENPSLLSNTESRLSKEEINTLLKKTLRLLRFRGVFPCDLIPKRMKWNEKAIVNTDPHFLPGLHYIAVCVRRRREILYFDPLNLNIERSFPTLFAVLKERNVTVIRALKSPIQAPSSKFCGFFCIEWLLLLQYPHVKLKAYRKKEKYLKENNKICVQNIIKMIRAIKSTNAE